MMDGRVKTLHPKVHGALLGLRDDPAHVDAMLDHGIEPIDLVVVNLYPFEKTVSEPGASLEDAMEQIDIGGPALIRSAAKNWRDVAIVVSTESYAQIISEMKKFDGALPLATRARLAVLAFKRTSEYDSAILSYLSKAVSVESQDRDAVFPESLDLPLRMIHQLRYGENPHQVAALYSLGRGGIAHAEVLSGKEMSFNNYLDSDAAWNLVNDFNSIACAIMKHTNPAGVALGTAAEIAYRRALETDPVSAFGGIVAFNCVVDAQAARAVIEIFTEVVIAPGYSKEALEILSTRKNLRVIRVDSTEIEVEREMRTISGGMLVQSRDDVLLQEEKLKVVTTRLPTSEERRALEFAWVVCKHTKSNAIVYARDGQTVGIGAGQMSRVDSVRLGAERARLPLDGSVMASDAFFPFRDGINAAAKYGITAIIQPGGSVRDGEVIKAADEHNLTMLFTGVRHFKH